MNLAFNRGDDENNVTENYKRFVNRQVLNRKSYGIGSGSPHLCAKGYKRKHRRRNL